MGIFTRFRDIISANINGMLDKAEDPEKLIRLMIREMEDTLIELKAACAGVIAYQKRVQRQLEQLRPRVERWGENAERAVNRGRDDLAREALLEKRRFTERLEALEEELAHHNSLIDQYQDDIRQLEDRIRTSREKERSLVQRHIRASSKKRAQEDIRRIDSPDAVFKFEQLENRIERMEAEADLVNYGRTPSVKGEFDDMLADDAIEKELKALKSTLQKKDENALSV
ncbi:MAG: phage shock protein PspA [Deltaproteobacteria bacterium]|nr:phage shock protein PspA [Deltaproteobacteria bacterium]